MATTLSDIMLPSSNTSIKEKTPPKGDNNSILMDQQEQNCSSSSQAKSSNKEDQDHCHATSTTPRSSSSTNSTTSSGKAITSGTNPGGTHTMGKFKEKRPEPLNLNPSLNQDIPLDLSVKSAGNMPSGRSVNTLETPRIFWLDNEALLIKPRLYSSSTSASQRVRLSSLAGDSPPITPNTPFMDLVCSPLTKTVADHHSNPASMLLDSNSSLHSLMSAQYHYNKQQQRTQFDDNLFAVANKLTPTNRFLVHHHFKGNNEIIKTPRRSCSTDNLTSLSCMGGQLPTFKALQSYRSQQQSNQRLSLQQQHNPTTADGKKNSISPLATKNLSSFKSGSNRFSYSGKQIANCNGTPTTTAGFNDDNMKGSLTVNVTGDQSQSSDNMRTLDSGPKALTPTSVANATANLLNIHLDSPTNQGPTLMEGLTSTLGSITSINDLLATQKSPTDQNMDPLISAAYCHHHQQQQQHQNQFLRSSLNSSSSSSTFGVAGENLDHNSKQHLSNNNLGSIYCQQANLSGLLTNNGLTSLSSSTTLNTPTLVSPSQLKSGSSICFLPSPLSPMSSVFELPSPLLMFPPPPATCTSQNLPPQVGFSGSAAVGDQARSNKACSPTATKTTPELVSQTTTTVSENQQHQASSRGDQGGGSDNKSCQSSTTTTTTTAIPANHARGANSEANLSLLVTSAVDKLDVVDVDDEVSIDNMRMEIDTQDMISQNPTNLPNVNNDLKEVDQVAMLNDSRNLQARPATVIPRILVSDSCLLQQQQQQQQHQHQHNEGMIGGGGSNDQTQSQHRIQRDMVGKRALSPQSFRARVSVYHNERHESSSAPPDVYQTQARSKIKSAAEPDLVHRGLGEQQQQHQLHHQQQQHQSDLCIRPRAYQQNVLPANQANYHNQHYKSNAPYPDIQPYHWQPTHVGQQQQQQQQQAMSIKTGGLRPSSAEPLSRSQCSSGEHLGDSAPQFDVAAAAAAASAAHHHHHSQHLQNHHQHQQQPHQISSLGNIFSSNSEQHLRCSDLMLDSKSSAMSGQMSGQHHQFHSASVGELNRYQMNCGPSAFVVGPAPNNNNNNHQPHHQQQLTSAAFFQQQQQQQQHHYQPALAGLQHPLATTNLMASHNSGNHLQSSMMAKIDNMIEQAPIPVRIVPSLSSNQLAQGHHQSLSQQQQHEARSFHHECESMESTGGAQLHPHPHQQQPRALSAEVRAISRSESSCSSEDFCFRPRSATTAKKYQCDQCTKAFTRSDMLTRHKRLHSGDRPFQCNECKQEFSRSDHLSTHMRTHTGEKPYKCKLCSYSACRKDMITRHMKVHNRS